METMSKYEKYIAIVARINGEWDNPQLKKIGSLSMFNDDVNTIMSWPETPLKRELSLTADGIMLCLPMNFNEFEYFRTALSLALGEYGSNTDNEQEYIGTLSKWLNKVNI